MSITIPVILIKVYHRLFRRNFLRFVFVGGIGFVVNYLALTIFYTWLSLSIVPSQLIGAELALLSTFVGNNFWAFRNHQHISVRKKFARYHGTSWAAIAITSSTVIILVHFTHMHYGVALVIAAVIGMVWNYTWNRKVIFKQAVSS